MPERVRLTVRMIAGLEAPSTETIVWDSEVFGLGLRMRPSGRKTYVLQYSFGQRSRRLTIGLHGSPWTPEMARAEGIRLLKVVVDGKDPLDAREVARAELTVAELCDVYVEVGLATRKPDSITSAKSDIENHIKPLLGRKMAAEILPGDVDQLLLDIAEGKTARIAKTKKKRGRSRVRGGKGAANAAVTTLCSAFNFGIRRGVRPDNPALGVRKFPGKKLGRFLSPAELARLGEVLAAAEALDVESLYAVAAIRLLILTGCRKMEILSLQRSWIDSFNGCFRLPDSKTGAKIVHVGPAVFELIDAIPEIDGNPYLIPGAAADTHLVNLQKVWKRIRAAAGLGDLRIHDLRHAFASLGATGGESLLIVGALLGHKSSKTTERYAHLSDHPLKGAAERISTEAARLLGVAQTQTPEAEKRRTDVALAPPGMGGLLGKVIDTRWLDTPAAATYVGHTVKTLHTYRWMGTGPRCRKVGRRMVYAQGDLDAWLAERSARARSAA